MIECCACKIFELSIENYQFLLGKDRIRLLYLFFFFLFSKSEALDKDNRDLQVSLTSELKMILSR